MALAWIKMHIGLLDNDAFRRLSADARLSFLVAVMLAGKQGQDGRLEIRGVGPMTVSEIAFYTNLPEKRQEISLAELVAINFLSKDSSGTYIVERFQEKAAADLKNAERQKKHRDKRKMTESNGGSNALRNDEGNALRNVTHNGAEEEEDKDTDISATALPGKPERVPRNGRGEPSAEDLATWSILAEAVKIVWEHCRPAYSQSEWRKRNKAAAAMLVEQGHDAGEVAEVLSVMYTHPKASDTYGRSTKLMVLVENWQRLTELADGLDGNQRDRALRGEYLPVV